MSLKAQLKTDMKDAMRAKDKVRLGVIRLTNSAIKQKEVDERIELDDNGVLAVIEKMLKQRRDSVKQYQDAGREELAEGEAAEIKILEGYLPEQLSDDELNELIDNVIEQTGAQSMRDMGKVMGQIKPKVQGRANMGKVSALIKGRLL